MKERIQRAYDNHKRGYNCAQSVVCSYSDLLGVDEEILFRMSEGFGLGMGRMGRSYRNVDGSRAAEKHRGSEKLQVKARDNESGKRDAGSLFREKWFYHVS